MPSIPGEAAAACVSELGLDAADARTAVERLMSDSATLMTLLEHVAAVRKPDTSKLPDVDKLVQDKLHSLYAGKADDPSLIEKKKGLGPQNKLLLAMLLDRIGEPVPLFELLLANNLSTDTPKRLRELREEQGGWQLDVGGTGRASSYRLLSPVPDLAASARWWLRNNIRESKQMNAQERILTLLKARLGEPVPLADVRYVNPEKESGGRGRARQPQGETTRRLRALREEGWQVYSGLDNVVEGLMPSDYIMLNTKQLPAYERMKPKVWTAVITRDGRACQSCGWTPNAGSSQGRKCLEVHHRDPQRARPEDVNDPGNLITLCNICHDAVN